MGLDMFLYKKTLIEHDGDREIELIGLPDHIEPCKVVYIVEDAGYWRKANAIHRWFVQHVQAGQDNGGTYCVRHEQLQQLLNAVETVLALPERAHEVLPTQAGFFFGNTEYGEGYWNDLRETKRIVRQAVSHKQSEFEYCASW